MKPVLLRFLIEVGLCVLVAIPFPQPDRGYGWMWVLFALYLMRLVVFLNGQITGWTYFYLFGKDEIAAHIGKSLEGFKIKNSTEYYDAESYLNSAGAALVDYVKILDAYPKDSKGIDSIEPQDLSSAIRAAVFSSEMTGVLDASKTLDPFGAALMFKAALRAAASKHYKPLSFRSLAD